MSALEYWRQCPPISRTIATSAAVMSILIHTKMISYVHFVFYPPFLMKLPPNIWSIATCFLLTGSGFSIIMDTYFLYTYSAKLETASPKFSQPGDFFTYILFVCFTSLGLCYLITGPGFYTSALILALCYTGSQDARGQMATLYVVTIPAQWMPYCLILLTWVTAGTTPAIVSLIGLMSAHLHLFLTKLWPEFGGGRNLLPTPGFIRRMWEAKQTTVTNRGYGTAIAPGRPKSAEQGSGPLPDSWKSRGSGHRLG
ncbi:hypothetical protein HYALB_00012100 [Hymenoscyphus albidus]|uniref:Derlin n=1 Tax=Hymenoscyphus albidus TaxID=595503 RepID=A0A9N9LM21_9HELO|nr:hypothetical protein HYALB_00012100 [Hymenoscyphus albidus]